MQWSVPYPTRPLLGSDPEIVLVSSKTGKMRRAGMFLPETLDPKNVASYSHQKQGKIHIDGMLAELNPEPVHCREWVLDRLRVCLMSIYEALESKDVDLSAKAVIHIPKITREKASKEELELGCEPDYNAYTGKANILPINAEQKSFRTGGGHIHLSKNSNSGRFEKYGNDFIPNHSKVVFGVKGRKREIVDTYEPIIEELVTVLDYMCGLPCVILDEDDAAKRRKLYGQAGSYRIPEHGIEYRVLSNFWMRHPALTSFAFQLARTGLQIAVQDVSVVDELKEVISIKDVQQIINEGNKEAALEVMPKLAHFYRNWVGDPIIEFLNFVHGMGTDVLFSPDLKENWCIPTKGFMPSMEWKSHSMGFCDFLKRLELAKRQAFDKLLSPDKISFGNYSRGPR